MYELKKVKFFDEMSEETPCFKAEIWENGKKVADVKNNGQGGCNDVYPERDSPKDTYEKYMALEYELVERADQIDQIRTLQGKGLVLKKDNKIKGHVKFPMGITKWKKHPQFKSWNKKTIADFQKQGYQIMNTNL